MYKLLNSIDRNFWPTCLLVFIILFAPLMLREWLTLHVEGLDDVQWHTTSMAQLLKSDLGTFRSLPEIISDLRNPQTFSNFDQHVRQKLGHLGLLDVKIYDRSGEIAYALDRELIGKIFLLGEGQKKAFAGTTVSELTDRASYFTTYSLESGTNLAEVFVPIAKASGEVPYVLEAYYDYTPILQRNHRLLRQSALSLLVTTLFVLALLIYFYKSRQKMRRKVAALEAILPICMHCKKIHTKRNDHTEEWVEIETYLSRHEDLAFSHGICNECLQTIYPDSKAARNNGSKH